MVTAILDTNVFIRAALRPRSPSARVVDAYLDGKFQLVLSQAVLQELVLPARSFRPGSLHCFRTRRQDAGFGGVRKWRADLGLLDRQGISSLDAGRSHRSRGLLS